MKHVESLESTLDSRELLKAQLRAIENFSTMSRSMHSWRTNQFFQTFQRDYIGVK